MLSLKYLQENQEEAIKALKIKNFDATEIIGKIIDLDEKEKLLKRNRMQLRQK